MKPRWLHLEISNVEVSRYLELAKLYQTPHKQIKARVNLDGRPPANKGAWFEGLLVVKTLQTTTMVKMMKMIDEEDDEEETHLQRSIKMKKKKKIITTPLKAFVAGNALVRLLTFF